jgi:hypothetical protein
MEGVDDFDEKQEAVDFMLNHIFILCGRDQPIYDYFLKWIGCMIQRPSVKLPMPVFVSAEGGGKGSLLRLFTAILGDNKILQTQEPSEEVWGKFNSLMLNAYLVCLDEINKKEMKDCEGKIKGLITEPTMRINDKGKSRFPVVSYHKFIAFSNPDAYGNEPMTTTEGDRRKFFVQCSDELVQNHSYFNTFYKLVADVDAMKSVFEYFNTMEDVISVTTMPLPVSEYHQELKAMSVPPLKLFLLDFLSKNPGDAFTTNELYVELKNWCVMTGIRYECSSLQFACRIANLKIKGLEKQRNIGAGMSRGWGVSDECRAILFPTEL